MLSFSFTVGNADDARTAAEVCDFLAERLAPGAAPTVRRRNAKPAEPAAVASQPEQPVVTDAAELYAALAGGTPTAPVAETPADAAPPPAETREAKVDAARAAIKEMGGTWFGDYLKANIPPGVKLSEFTDDQLDAIHAAAVLASKTAAALA